LPVISFTVEELTAFSSATSIKSSIEKSLAFCNKCRDGGNLTRLWNKVTDADLLLSGAIGYSGVVNVGSGIAGSLKDVLPRDFP